MGIRNQYSGTIPAGPSEVMMSDSGWQAEEKKEAEREAEAEERYDELRRSRETHNALCSRA